MKKKLLTLLALLTTIVSGAWATDVDLSTGASYDFTTITADDFSGVGENYWVSKNNGTYYENGSSFEPTTATAFMLNATDEIAAFAGLKVIIGSSTGRVRIYTNGNGLYFNSTNAKLVFPGLIANQVITIEYANVTTDEAQFAVTNASASQNTTTHVETLTVTSDGEVTLTYNSKKFYIKTILINASVPVTKHSVTYSLGAATGGTLPTQADVAEGGTFTVADAPGDLIPPTGKEFKCWNDGTTDYNPGDTYTMGTSNVTLTAQYQDEATKYTITYDLGDATEGTAPTQASLAAGKTFTVAAIPSDLVAPANKVFTGWLCDIDDILYAPGATYTMTAAATTFTAQYSSCVVVYDLKSGVGSTTKTADNATYTEGISFSFSNTAGRIKITAATGQMFKSGDIVIFSGTVGNLEKSFGIKYGATTNLGTDLYKTDAKGDGSVQGTLTLSEDASSIYIGRYDGTTTTITSFMVCRLAKPMTMNAYEWTTFVSDKALDFTNSDVKAYIVTGHTGSALNKTEVTKVEANTPLLLNAPEGTYNIPVAASGTAYTDNKLKAGSGAAVAKEEGKTRYVLSLDDYNNIAFLKINNDPATVPANKAYLEFDGEVNAPTFGFGDATAIDEVRSKTEDVRGDFYNLNGQRVAQPTKGLYIVNGKKVIVK